MAEDSVANQEPIIVDDFDLDFFLLSDFPIFDMDLNPLPEPLAAESDISPIVYQSSGSPSPAQYGGLDPPLSASPDSVSSFASYIEKFLMDDVDWRDEGEGLGEDGAPDFFSDGSLVCLDGPKSDVGNPQVCDAFTMEAQSKEEKKVSVVVGVGEDDDDFVNKKRRRQMRNRESAMISRERKKMYLRDLELKSKHLSSECRRLEYALRCCLEENVELRRNLQTNKPCIASMAKQESAVLFLESLLLGSLFWFVSLACLFLVPGLPNPNLKVVSRSARDLATAVARTVSINSVMLRSDLKLEMLRLRRRWRGMRGRMKFFLFPLHAVLA